MVWKKKNNVVDKPYSFSLKLNKNRILKPYPRALIDVSAFIDFNGQKEVGMK